MSDLYRDIKRIHKENHEMRIERVLSAPQRIDEYLENCLVEQATYDHTSFTVSIEWLAKAAQLREGDKEELYKAIETALSEKKYIPFHPVIHYNTVSKHAESLIECVTFNWAKR